jgi:hypothetical protein
MSISELPNRHTGDMASLPQIHCEVALPEDLRAAQELVAREYAKQQYDRNPQAFSKLASHTEQPSTTVFIAKKNTTTIGTISLFQDSDIGLPMEQIYHKEVQTLRAADGTVAEVGQLAIDAKHINRFHERIVVLNSLFKLVLQTTMKNGISHLCITDLYPKK